MNIYNIINT